MIVFAELIFLKNLKPYRGPLTGAFIFGRILTRFQWTRIPPMFQYAALFVCFSQYCGEIHFREALLKRYPFLTVLGGLVVCFLAGGFLYATQRTTGEQAQEPAHLSKTGVVCDGLEDDCATRWASHE